MLRRWFQPVWGWQTKADNAFSWYRFHPVWCMCKNVKRITNQQDAEKVQYAELQTQKDSPGDGFKIKYVQIDCGKPPEEWWVLASKYWDQRNWKKLDLVSYSNAYWAGDTTDRHTTTGYCVSPQWKQLFNFMENLETGFSYTHYLRIYSCSQWLI